MTIRKKPNLRNTLCFYGARLLLMLGAAVFALCFLLRASADQARFERLGPFGGTVRSLLISSGNSRIVYLGTSDGQLFKSLDGGLSWNHLYPGLNRRQLVVDTIVEDPVNADHLYVGAWDLRSNGGGLFQSSDAGRSWSELRLPVEHPAIRGFAISRANPASMIAGTGAGVFVTADGGNTWKQAGAQLAAFSQAESVAIDPEDPRFLFVGTWHLGYRSSDFGKTWVRNARGMIEDSDVFSIAIDIRNPKIMFASACTGLYRSIDRGASWKRLKVFPTSYLVRAQVVCIDTADSETVYGGTTEGLFVSRDSGSSWRRVTPPDLVVNAVQVGPANSKLILIGTESRGVLRSEDGGNTWRESNAGFVNRPIARIAPDPAAPARFLVGESSEGQAGGIYAYDTVMGHWSDVGEQGMHGGGLLAFLALPGKSGRIAGTAKGAFLQRRDESVWKSLPGPISKLAVYDFALDQEQHWLFAGTNDGVYRTRLEDLDFQKPSNYSIIPRVLALLCSHSRAGRIFAGTHMGVLRSDDSGETWTSSSAGIPDHTIVECLVFSPTGEDHMFAGTTAGLYESTDRGGSWLRVRDGRLGVDIPAVIFLDADGKRIMVADNTAGGVFLSEDAGVHWEKIERPEFGSPVRTLIQDPRHSDIVYLGTASEGVYRVDLSKRAAEEK